MQAALATLALHPKVAILFLALVKVLFSFNVDVLEFGFTARTYDRVSIAQYVFAAEACLLHYCKLEDTLGLVAFRWHVNITGMFA